MEEVEAVLSELLKQQESGIALELKVDGEVTTRRIPKHDGRATAQDAGDGSSAEGDEEQGHQGEERIVVTEEMPLHAFDKASIEAIYAEVLPPYTRPSEPPSPVAQYGEAPAVCDSNTAGNSSQPSTPISPPPPFEGASPSTEPPTANFAAPSESRSSTANTPATACKNPFLFPMLTEFEKQRLTSLWYLTRGIEKFPDLLNHLNDVGRVGNALVESFEALCALAAETLGYEMAIVGMLDQDALLCVAAHNYPVSVIARKDTTCGHTVNLPPETVLSLDDMQDEVQRSLAAHSVYNGLRSYAGTQLCYRIPNTDRVVALGTMCVLGFTPAPPLTERSKKALVRFSRAVMHSLINHARLERSVEQKRMHEIISRLAENTSSSPNIVEDAVKAAGEIFQNCVVSFRAIQSGSKIPITGEGEIPYADFTGHLWENSKLIEDIILDKNHQPTLEVLATRTVRAIAVKVTDDRALIVETNELRRVFDDIDAMFVRSASLVIFNALQDRLLRQALNAKASFLRSVQHSLRTSLNGILSASEMLLDEAASQRRSSENSSRPGTANGASDTFSFHPQHKEEQRVEGQNLHGTIVPIQPYHVPSGQKDSLLNIIDTSGRSLLTIINNLLNLDSTAKPIQPKNDICNLFDVEQEVLESVMLGTSRYKVSQVSLTSHSELPDHINTVVTDTNLLKHALSAIVQNAMDATEQGHVTITVSSPPDYEGIVFDVRDSGMGIKEDHFDRIFEPFEKVDPYSQHAGLGLTFATRYAQSIGATVELITSTPGQGSHFRMSLPTRAFACSRRPASLKLLPTIKEWKYWFDDANAPENGVIRHFCKDLSKLGYQKGDKGTAQLIVREAESEQAAHSSLDELHHDQIIIRLIPAADYRRQSKRFDQSRNIIYCELPLCRNRLLSTLEKAHSTLERLAAEKLSLAQTIHEQATAHQPPAPSVGRNTALSPGVSQGIQTELIHALLVDDNEMNLNILKTYCNKRKIRFAAAKNGREAYDEYQRGHKAGTPYTFCAMDLQMPNVDGAEATRLIRKYESAHNLTPCNIIMVTGQSSEEDKARAKAVGCDGYHVKPLRIRTLDEWLANHFYAS